MSRRISHRSLKRIIQEELAKLNEEGLSGELEDVEKAAKEVPEIKRNFGENFLTVTPGIRIQQKSDDQSRVATLEEAIRIGSDYIVLGREITASENISKMIKKVESYII